MSLSKEQIAWVVKGLEVFKDDHPISDSQAKSKLVAALFCLVKDEGGDDVVIVSISEPFNRRMMLVSSAVLE